MSDKVCEWTLQHIINENLWIFKSDCGEIINIDQKKEREKKEDKGWECYGCGKNVSFKAILVRKEHK